MNNWAVADDSIEGYPVIIRFKTQKTFPSSLYVQ